MCSVPDIITTDEIRAWDRFTLKQNGWTGTELMDQAALALANHWESRHPKGTRVLICCGMGGNGGDGLAVGRILADRAYKISVWLSESPDPQSDTGIQLHRLNEASSVKVISANQVPDPREYDTLIDALRGSGTSRPAEGLLKDQIDWINHSRLPVFCLDLPSGMPGQIPFSQSWTIVRATETLCLDPIKLNLLLPESAPWRGKVTRIPFSLSTHFRPSNTLATINRAPDLAALLPARPRFMHKGTAGHALLVAGSGKYPGAAWLCAEACARAGAGRTTLSSTESVWNNRPAHLPEIIKHLNGTDTPSVVPDVHTYHSVAIGPGIGTASVTASVFGALLKKASRTSTPLILDADALNILSQHPKWMGHIPEGSILTPHLLEFDRLTGTHNSSWERLATLQKLATERGWIVVLKNAFTFMSNAEGELFLTARGNTALARGGSGDMLTGILAAIMARGASPEATARIATWLLGRAAECAAKNYGEEGLLQTEILQHLPQAFTDLHVFSGSDEFFGYF